MPGHSRVRSLITVLPDGGRQEDFVINWPDDRISTPRTQYDAAAALPAGAAAGVAVLENTSGQRASAELFRLRDADDNVIGIASRLAGNGGAMADPGRSASNWLLVIPSRGALFLAQADSIDVTADQQPSEAGVVAIAPAQTAAFWAGRTQVVVSAMAPVVTGPATTGRVVRGTDEFDGLGGRFTEIWTLAEVHDDGSTSGQIRLSTMVEAVR